MFGWRLYSDGNVEALLADESLIESTPILPGDACLYPGRSRHMDGLLLPAQHRQSNP